MRDLKERVWILAAVVVLGAAVRLAQITWLQPLNWDEIEFFRATDWVRRGLVPFRDFWEHHTPLQWFIFAPFSALTSSEGVNAVIFMRWMQVPLWILIFWIANRWMRDLGLSLFARWTTMAIAASSSLLMLPAVDYRVDVPACALYLAGMLFLQRSQNETGKKSALLAGVMFCLAGFANLRLGPLLALTVLLNRVTDRRGRRWGGQSNANFVFLGVIVTFAAGLAYFAATDSLQQLYQHVWYENYLGDKYAERVPLGFVHRMILPFGFAIYGTGQVFDLARIDLGGVVIVILGLVGLVRALRHWRQPGELFFVAFLQLSNMLFVATMKFVYHYHLEIVVLMMLPFIAAEIDRLVITPARIRVALAYVIVTALLNVGIVMFRGKELDLAYQDVIMREVHRHTPAGSTVFDGVGWALRREPAYRFWFLPELVRQLVAKGHAEPLRVQDWIEKPPAAIITDRPSAMWFGLNPQLGVFAIRHYLPFWRNLWLPGLSWRTTPEAPAADWLVPADGVYRIAASTSLANDEWFFRPLAYGIPRPPLEVAKLPADAPVVWVVNGERVTPEHGRLRLKQRDHLRAVVMAPAPVGIMLFRGDDPIWFRQPPNGVTIDSEGARSFHWPRLGAGF